MDKAPEDREQHEEMELKIKFMEKSSWAYDSRLTSWRPKLSKFDAETEIVAPHPDDGPFNVRLALPRCGVESIGPFNTFDDAVMAAWTKHKELLIQSEKGQPEAKQDMDLQS